MLSEQVIKIRTWILLIIGLLLYPTLLLVGVVNLILKSIYKPRKKISGEVALVTGSANGLGKEIALKLAAKGCHIAVVDINEEAATITARLLSEKYNVKAKAFKANITQFEEVKILSQNVEDQLGPVTILVNNAGIMTFSSFFNPPPSEVQNMVNTNITAHIWTVRVFLDKMKELGKGHIVSVSSVAGLIACPRHMEYTATKFGVRGFIEALRGELFATNAEFIKTTTVFPYFLKTNVKVQDVVQKAGICHQIYPSISGEDAAEAVIEGIVTNQLTVYVPGFVGLLFRLVDLLPTSLQKMVFTDALGRKMTEKFSY